MSAGHEARTGIRSAAPGGGAITRRIAGDDVTAVGSGGSGGSGGSVSDAGGGDGGSGSAAGPSSQAGGAGGAVISSCVAVMSSQLVRFASRFRSESQSAESAALGVGRDGGGSSSRTSSPQSASSNMS